MSVIDNLSQEEAMQVYKAYIKMRESRGAWDLDHKMMTKYRVLLANHHKDEVDRYMTKYFGPTTAEDAY